VLTVSEPAFLATRSWYEAIPNSASDIGSKRCKRVFLLKRLSLLRSGIWIERGMKFTAGGGSQVLDWASPSDSLRTGANLTKPPDVLFRSDLHLPSPKSTFPKKILLFYDLLHEIVCQNFRSL
jgi:hypothetical protein